MRRAAICVLAGSVLACATSSARADVGSMFGTFSWPVVGPVIRGYEPPPTPFSAGHRGIDIAVPFGTPIRAPADGTVTFAGWVAGSMFVTIDHGDGVRSTYSWLSQIMTSKGKVLGRREVFARTGHGHPDVPTPHLHFGVRVNGEYVDPMLFLGSGSLVDVIHLAELTGREAVVLAVPFRSPSAPGVAISHPRVVPRPRRGRSPEQRRGGGLVVLPRAPPGGDRAR